MKKLLLATTVVVLLSCNSKKEEKAVATVPPEVTVTATEGKELLKSHCYLCHNPSATEEQGRVAPPMVAIKAHYINQAENISKAEFTKQMVAFLNNPTEEASKMPGAVRRFGVMPKQAFPEGVIEKIAAYIYDYQIEEPEWFAKHWEDKGFGKWQQTGKAEGTTQNTPKTDAEIGKDIALSTKQILGKNLMGAIQKKGTLAALEFCNVKAYPLTDSMALAKNAKIKRVSDKNRNPNNKANAEELQYIAEFKKQMAQKQDPKPIVKEVDGKVHFYYPIPTNTMCLQCHGKAENIKSEVKAKIQKLYPNDLAVGYSENDVRGIWSIVFDKK